jgi:hypothetical protein
VYPPNDTQYAVQVLGMDVGVGLGVGVAVGESVVVGVGADICQYVKREVSVTDPERCRFCCQATVDETSFRLASIVEIETERVKISVVSDEPNKFHWFPAVVNPNVPSVILEKPASRIFLTDSNPSSASITARAL